MGRLRNILDLFTGAQAKRVAANRSRLARDLSGAVDDFDARLLGQEELLRGPLPSIRSDLKNKVDDSDLRRLLGAAFGTSRPRFSAPPSLRQLPLDLQQAVADDVLKKRRIGSVVLRKPGDLDDSISKLMGAQASSRYARLRKNEAKLPGRVEFTPDLDHQRILRERRARRGKPPENVEF